MRREPELSAAYARLALQSGVAPAPELLRGTSLSEKALARMDFIAASELAILFRNYDRCVNDSAWTARLGSQFNIAAHGPLGFAALSAPTLGEALDTICQLMPSRNTAATARTDATTTHYCAYIEHVAGPPDFGRWLVEVILKILEVLLASILGHPVGGNVAISFAHCAPRDAERLLAAYDGTVQFDAPDNSIAIPLAWRQLPSPLYDESVFRANVVKCRELIAAREHEGSVVQAVQDRLSNHFDKQILYADEARPPPTLEQLADAMHLTSRTLIRRLQDENSTFKALLESSRKAYAQRLLGDARRNVADVAELLGYREPANFTRAFRRWYGVTPTAWRRS
jgi:AraC-like DNA-binding protein